MKITRNLLDKAVTAKILSDIQAEKLMQFLKMQAEEMPSFNATHVLYYFGGLIAISAMSLFMNLGWENFGGWGILFLSIIYAICGLILTHHLDNKGNVVPAGISATFVVALAPLSIYGFQQAMGWWPDNSTYRDYHVWIKWHWIFMELGTLMVGVILAWIYRYPFMVMPVGVTLWYTSMDLAVMLTGHQSDWEFSTVVSMYFGLAILLMAFWIDIRSRHSLDYAFWLYLFGVITFWGGLSSQISDNEVSKFIYFCINLLMMVAGVMLMRRVFVIFGTIGCLFYLGHLSWSVFENSAIFPIVLTIIGFLFIYLGTLWQKYESQITEKFQSVLPRSVRELLQSRQE